MNAKSFVDTNIFIYAHDTANPKKQKISQELIFNGILRENLIISTQVLSEFIVTALKKINLPFKYVKKEVEFLKTIQIVEINYSMILEALDLKHRYKYSFWDSLIIVSAQRSGCEILISEDFNQGQKIGSLIIKNPFI
jgi:predicted nucleic acid-binding protein